MSVDTYAPLVIGQPERLTNDEFLLPASLCVYHQWIHDRITVHWHEFYELNLVRSGTGTHVLNGASRAIARGCFWLLTPADFHALDPVPGAPIEIFNIVFSEDALSEEMRHLLLGDFVQYQGVLAETTLAGMEAEVCRLLREIQEQRTGYRQIMRGTLERILIDALRYASLSEPEVTSHPADPGRKVGRALTYLQHHFREPLTLAQVADHAHLSPTYFSGCFHETTGVPFQQYLRQLRLRFAHSLLAVSDVSITDLCLASGFSSLSNFERAFKAYYGRSPRDHRACFEESRCLQ